MSFTDFVSSLLPAGIAPETAFTVMAGLTAFLTVGAVWTGLVERDPMRGRVRALLKRRETMKTGLMAPRRRRQGPVRAIGLMRMIVGRLDLMRGQYAEATSQRLSQAGWRSKDALVLFLFAKVTLPMVFAGASILVFYVADAYDLPVMARLLVASAGVVAGAYAPELFVRNAVTKRKKALTKALPDALDLLVICTEAGLGLDAALTRVADEIGPNSPELADELSLTAIELGFLPERRQALDNLNARTDLASIRGVVNSLIQTERYGTPLATSLRVLAAEYRNERMLRAEDKAARLPAVLTVPMIIFIMPSLFVVLLGPAAMKAIDALRSALGS